MLVTTFEVVLLPSSLWSDFLRDPALLPAGGSSLKGVPRVQFRLESAHVRTVWDRCEEQVLPELVCHAAESDRLRNIVLKEQKRRGYLGLHLLVRSLCRNSL